MGVYSQLKFYSHRVVRPPFVVKFYSQCCAREFTCTIFRARAAIIPRLTPHPQSVRSYQPGQDSMHAKAHPTPTHMRSERDHRTRRSRSAGRRSTTPSSSNLHTKSASPRSSRVVDVMRAREYSPLEYWCQSQRDLTSRTRPPRNGAAARPRPQPSPLPRAAAAAAAHASGVQQLQT